MGRRKCQATACAERLAHLQADYNGRSTLHLAVAENRTEIVSVLLDKGAKTDLSDTWGRTPLSDALTNQRVDIAAALIGKGVYACSAGGVAVLKVLLVRAVPGNVSSCTIPVAP